MAPSNSSNSTQPMQLLFQAFQSGRGIIFKHENGIKFKHENRINLKHENEINFEQWRRAPVAPRKRKKEISWNLVEEIAMRRTMQKKGGWGARGEGAAPPPAMRSM